ncbi:MAG: magnesium transporter CorA family protein [Gammaproteobacteria bacterium]|nr:magnesium transporter CorA family protein [Gammaproteobacteria bacterium]
MITTYSLVDGRFHSTTGFIPSDRLGTTAWVDLLDPTRDEEQHVEGLLGLDLPTREEMKDIEDSRRLYAENGALYLTATVMVQSDSEYPRADDFTFVLTRRCLVTVRYASPKAVRLFAGRAEKDPTLCDGPEHALLGLVDTLIERVGDNIAAVSDDLDGMVHAVLAPDVQSRRRRLDYAQMLRQLERDQILVAKARVSLNSLNRLLVFLGQPELRYELHTSTLVRATMLARDIESLVDHTHFLGTSISFELAAILGMINIEQNGIIKIFSVAAVVFMPPTLVASLYGMNFDFMPELHQHWGYPVALGLMFASAVLTYLFFKRRGWL